ncbi:probable LRR receptor-like serine/threonine-protein kinase At1g07650 isoform X3 [Olea europaea var. sylvestris]|uniref:probable LRR receptor-like serine/threonine-protein kinase At1g07650 isoform X3 n=1 Tax=Olea europaea var. sylvestris TaxID=158386 RepID=UPI000C1CD010|nr:probable LRR receptor-like serine/threonine-protein kinase At1g07650 isoform X3 [Olea europaea var. sylvestris]
MSKAILIFMFTLTILLLFKATIISARSGYLPDEEKNALREIADQLGKKDWDFNLNPCDNNSNWNTPKREDIQWYTNSIICNCNFPGGVCHVKSIFLKGQDLAGVLPPSLAKLPYLKTICRDLSGNYLNGTIPMEWGATKLEYMCLLVNRLSGPIPKFLGNITTLVYLGLGSNRFNGTIPAELGKLVNLKHLYLYDNNLTGELPIELNNLKMLTDLWLISNNFTGKLPNFRSWTNLKSLVIKGSGFEGPIPPSISILKNLEELIISNLNGGASEFPLLKDMRNLTYLTLSSCNITGSIPNYLADIGSMKAIDLSFNNLKGEVPDFDRLPILTNLFLTSNFLSGQILKWIQSISEELHVDLSYNNFNETSDPSICRNNINLFRSFSGENSLEHGKCLTPCSKDWYSFYVNCGGGEVTVGNKRFEADVQIGGSVQFVHSKENWGASSTGQFPSFKNHYNANNVSVLKMKDSELYTDARLSPLSLTYYGRCLANGNYTVTLHFAEIVFRDDNSFQSLGRRMFDVYIQDELKLKDFDIKKEAKGVAKAVKKPFNATVKNITLDIRFYYSGKGSIDIPFRTVYGPLISAISVESDFKPPSGGTNIFIPTGVTALAIFFILIILIFSWWKGYIGGRISREEELRGLDLRTGFFTFRQIKAATNNFDAANKIGEGGFGSVYKGILLDGSVIAVKQLSSKSKQGNREFVNEIGMISGLQHPNLVKLYGCCIEGSHLVLVYEYMENNSLARALYGPEERQLKMDWPTRQRICIGIARGLAFLHEESTLKIVHRDIKPNNILLDKDLNPRISDFGLAKLDEDDNSHISTRVAGTIGYMAPEYAMWGYLTYKADVYSFGVVALEIVSGKSNMKYRPSESFICLLDWATILQNEGRLMELVDTRLGSNFNMDESKRTIKVALLCTNPSPSLRPPMSMVCGMLEGYINVQEFKIDPSIYEDELKLQSLREKFEDLKPSSSKTQTLSNPSDALEIGSSFTSSRDLYPPNLISL